MTVELTLTHTLQEVDEQTMIELFRQLCDIHESESSTSGTYTLERNSFQPERAEDGFKVRIGLQLTDVDDSDYPVVKDDLAEKVANLTGVSLTEEEVKDKVRGSVN